MKYKINGIPLILLAGILLLMSRGQATAGGPFYVTGPWAAVQGIPYRWPGNILQYYTDLGSLGSLSNTEANTLVSSAFQVWQDVDSADIGFQRAGALGSDITSDNVFDFLDSFGVCSDTSQPENAILYDLDGSMLSAFGMDYNSVLGFAGIACLRTNTNDYTRGWSVLNGRMIDGLPGHPSLTQEEFRSAFVHEFGHLIGLDHSQVNLNCLIDTCTDEEMAGLPIMFPVYLQDSQNSPTVDDISSVSMLYPSSNFSTGTGRIRGSVLFSDGKTPAQGFNVVARNVADPGRIAVSSVSGYLFTPAAGNDFAFPDDTYVLFGSRDTAVEGYYDIAGLPPGDYTLEVEAINNSGDYPFTDDSGVGPIGDYLGFQFKMPGRCSPQYLHVPSSPGDSCSEQTPLHVEAGQDLSSGADIILLGTPSRYDAWEDGP